MCERYNLKHKMLHQVDPSTTYIKVIDRETCMSMLYVTPQRFTHMNINHLHIITLFKNLFRYLIIQFLIVKMRSFRYYKFVVLDYFRIMKFKNIIWILYSKMYQCELKIYF